MQVLSMMAPYIIGDGSIANRDMNTTWSYQNKLKLVKTKSSGDLECKWQSLVSDLDTSECHENIANSAGAAQDGEDAHGCDPVVELCLASRHLTPAWPIRSQYYDVSTNQKWKNFCQPIRSEKYFCQPIRVKHYFVSTNQELVFTWHCLAHSHPLL